MLLASLSADSEACGMNFHYTKPQPVTYRQQYHHQIIRQAPYIEAEQTLGGLGR